MAAEEAQLFVRRTEMWVRP